MGLISQYSHCMPDEVSNGLNVAFKQEVKQEVTCSHGLPFKTNHSTEQESRSTNG